jgi:hypothetical protein
LELLHEQFRFNAFAPSPIDDTNKRLFVGRKDGFAALDATTGKVVGRSLMCSGVDAGGFDPEKKWIFESCGEDVISVIRQTTPDYYELIETIPTQLLLGLWCLIRRRRTFITLRRSLKLSRRSGEAFFAEDARWVVLCFGCEQELDGREATAKIQAACATSAPQK